jgi:hypothetical protein
MLQCVKYHHFLTRQYLKVLFAENKVLDEKQKFTSFER